MPHMRQTDHFNPLPPHGGRHLWKCTDLLNAPISIHSLRMEGDDVLWIVQQPAGRFQSTPSAWRETRLNRRLSLFSRRFQSTPSAWRETVAGVVTVGVHQFQSTPSAWRETHFTPFTPGFCSGFQSTPSAWRETAKLHRKAFFISPILVQSCKKGCKRLHSAPEKMVFFEKREKNLVRNLQHLSVRL